MVETNALVLKFRTADDKTRTVTIQPCNVNATEATAKALMDAMISSDAFVYQPSAKLGASVIQRFAMELF
ncbi:MAG: DUF2922 domain-containing protein [Synergistaceae bacterium]|nr:DUF2922 domain-containing protein [Synergistaceae bacterium]